MRRAKVLVHGELAGTFEEPERKRKYRFTYSPDYRGSPISLTLPVRPEAYEFESFPAFFDGLLPEGVQLEALLRRSKIDADDLFAQIVAVGSDLVGAVTVELFEGSPTGEPVRAEAAS